ncbi:hypothetical protein ACJIZ3_019838 [Penstemon smallii]|uniref:Uncharacterized protein n=1 Tax=Penstemon smallii TaxID=265156 RepID=A0ABD3T288_9LAMI
MSFPNVELISTETIKPSSPTPNHLRNFKLSLIDQITPPVFIPLTFFYQHDQLNHDNNQVKISHSLKHSLSNILTMFYPLAGKLNQEKSSIDCNDAGAKYIEAQVNARLSEIIKDPKMEQLKLFIPVQPLDQTQKSILSVKISFFTCGGIAIGICLSHKVADGTSLVVSKVTQNTGITKEKIKTKRFVFDKEKLENIKQVVVSEELKSPTRVETVSAFILHNVFKKTKFAAVHAVNLRQRSIPPLPDHVFGNSWSYAIALLSEQDDKSISGCAKKLRAAIRIIDSEFIKEVKNGAYMSRYSETTDLYSSGEIEFCIFSSWCRFPVYEVNFGWGKPVWACPTTLPFKNLVVLMSTPCGEGIEAWVNLVEEDMKLFDDKHHLMFL